MRFPGGILAVALLVPGGVRPADNICPAQPQPMPSAIDSAGLPPTSDGQSLITFSATASLNYPHRSWVVRVYERGMGQSPAVVIVRLRGREDCNLYEVETRWEAPLRPDDYASVASAVARFVTPPSGTFDRPAGRQAKLHLIMDGTGLDLRAQAPGWAVRRSLNLYEPDGHAISAVFRGLVLKVVPGPDVPRENWANY